MVLKSEALNPKASVKPRALEPKELTDRSNTKLSGAMMHNKRLMVDTRTPSLKMRLCVLLVGLLVLVEGRVMRNQEAGSVNWCCCQGSPSMLGKGPSQATALKSKRKFLHVPDDVLAAELSLD